MMKIAIAGGAGYTGGELIRILLDHPKVVIQQVISQSQQGKYIHEVHRDLEGLINLRFQSQLDEDFDALFLCLGHGRSAQFLEENNIPDEKYIIDLSNEFRAEGPDHDFVYGLPEWQRDQIRNSRKIANLGCFSTNIQLALLPLAQAGLLKGDITATAITGSTGAGLRPSPTTHFSWRANNLSIYKLGEHQHVPEIYKSLYHFQPSYEGDILKVQLRGVFTRGSFASVVSDVDCMIEKELLFLYRDYYKDHSLTIVTEKDLYVKVVVNTRRAYLIFVKLENTVPIARTMVDLVKGASGRADQILNR